MMEPKPYDLSQLFSRLTGREVSFTLDPKPVDSKAAAVLGTYEELPEKKPVVVRADLAVMGCLAGALLGLPDGTAMERALESPMNESVRDAIHEVLNIASTALSGESRVVFQSMATESVYCSTQALAVLKNPDFKSYYKMAVSGGASGQLTIFARF
jgi:hypothetical protein